MSKRTKHWTTVATVALLAGAFTTTATDAAQMPDDAAAPLLGKVGDRARDCVGSTRLDGGRDSAIRFVVWCGVQSGVARFQIDRAEGAPIVGFERRPRTTGDAAFRCHRSGQTVKCSGRKRGPVVVRGEIEVPASGRCALGTRVSTAGVLHVGKPLGCPGTRPPAPPDRPNDLRYMRGFRRGFGLDLDLHGDRAAIERRIRGLIRAWKRGDPVARYTASNLGLPLRAKDQRELEYRDEYLEQTASALERWVPRHAIDTYAGYDMDHEGGGIFYIGFVGDQEAQLAAFLRTFDALAPERIEPFPTPPTYSELRLGQYENELIELGTDSPLVSLISSIGIDFRANKVEVGTTEVEKVRRLLVEQFGTADPFLVVFERRGTLL